MFSLMKKYELRGAKRRVRLFNRFRIESVLKIAPYHTLKFGGIGKLAYLCTVVQRKATIISFKAFALTGRQGCAHNNPGRCPGLGASALSGRVERNLRKLKTSSLFAAGFKRLELWFKKKNHPSPRHHNTYPSSYSQHLFSWFTERT